MSGPLSGVRVLDFTRYQQGPFATALLADLGADVLKVEPRLDGEWGRQTEMDESGFSPYFETYNRGKRSITLDIRREQGRAIALQLAERADVLTENFRPGFMERAGLDWATLHARNPRLIVASASAFGPVGPLRSRPGYDHIAQAVSGLMVEQAGGPEHDPVPALPGAADQFSATMFAFGIAAALYAREHSGIGQQLDVSLLGSMVAFQGRQITRFLKTGKQGRVRWRRSPVYSHYRAADGWVAIAAQDPKRWGPLCRALGQLQLEHDPRFAEPWARHRNAAELEDALEAIFGQRTVAEWLSRLTAEDVPSGAVNSYHALDDDPDLAAQLQANGYLTEVAHPNLGQLRMGGVPLRYSATPAPPIRHAPELGLHTEDELLGLGYTWAQIEQLRRDEVI